MISYVTTATDVSRLRFAFVPLGEAVASLRMMGSEARRRPHLPWLREVEPKVRSTDLRLLLSLVPPTGYVPDFLTPGESLGQNDLNADLAAVRETRAETLVEEVSWMMCDPGTGLSWKGATAKAHRWMIDHPERAVQVIGDQLATYTDLALKPYWKRMHGSLQGDVHNRMAVAESAGAGAVLSSLNRRITWQNGRLEVASEYDYTA